MADLQFNIAKGRITELYNRVKNNDPAASALVVIPIDAGSVTDAVAQDVDTFAALVTAGVVERNANGWGRKVLTDTELTAWAPDDTNNRVDLAIPNQTWGTAGAGPTAGNVTDLVIAYDNDTAAGTDANLIPLVMVDFPITADGSQVDTVFNAAGFFRSS